MSHILVVSSDGYNLSRTLAVLNEAGYEARGAATFEDATRLLARHSPDLVIADECLGPFNGLHVIIRARQRCPDVAAIVTTRARSRGLEADARNLNVDCVVSPRAAEEWLASISRVLKEDVAVRSATVQ